jgi:hypothetical protein
MTLPNGHEASADSGHRTDHPGPSGALPPDRTPTETSLVAAHEDGDNDEQRADGNEPEAVPLQTGA